MPRSTLPILESAAFARSRDLVRSIEVHPSAGKPIAGGDVARWLLDEGRMLAPLARLFDQLCWRLIGDGVTLCRATLNLETLHPQIQGVMFRWWRDRAVTEEISYAHGMERTEAYLTSPLYRVAAQGETLRRRIGSLGEGGDEYEFPIFADLAKLGATDYFAGPMMMSDGHRFPASWATDAPNGFSERDIDRLTNLMPALAAVGRDQGDAPHGDRSAQYLSRPPCRAARAQRPGSARRGPAHVHGDLVQRSAPIDRARRPAAG
ncbi:MAG: hypothetical protein WDO24_26615 [Pseudomonadota bacterium]